MIFEFETNSQEAILDLNNFCAYVNDSENFNLNIYNTPNDPAERIYIQLPENLHGERARSLAETINLSGHPAEITTSQGDHYIQTDVNMETEHGGQDSEITDILNKFHRILDAGDLTNNELEFLRALNISSDIASYIDSFPRDLITKLQHITISGEVAGEESNESMSGLLRDYAAELLARLSSSSSEIINWFESCLAQAQIGDYKLINYCLKAFEYAPEHKIHDLSKIENLIGSEKNIDQVLAVNILINQCYLHEQTLTKDRLNQLLEQTTQLLSTSTEINQEGVNNAAYNYLSLIKLNLQKQIFPDHIDSLITLLNSQLTEDINTLILSISADYVSNGLTLKANSYDFIENKFSSSSYQHNCRNLDKYLKLFKSAINSNKTIHPEVTGQLEKMWRQNKLLAHLGNEPGNNTHDKILEFFRQNLQSSDKQLSRAAREFFINTLDYTNLEDNSINPLLDGIEQMSKYHGHLEASSLSKIEYILETHSSTEETKNKCLNILMKALSGQGDHSIVYMEEGFDVNGLSAEMQSKLIYYLQYALLFKPEIWTYICYIKNPEKLCNNVKAYHHSFQDLISKLNLNTISDASKRRMIIDNLTSNTPVDWDTGNIADEMCRQISWQNSLGDEDGVEYSTEVLLYLIQNGARCESSQLDLITKLIGEYDYNQNILQNLLTILEEALKAGGEIPHKNIKLALENSMAVDLLPELSSKLLELLDKEHESDSKKHETDSKVKNCEQIFRELASLNSESNLSVAKDTDYQREIIRSIEQKFYRDSELKPRDKVISEWAEYDVKAWSAKIKELSAKEQEEYLSEILAVLRQASILHSGKDPRYTQLIATINLLNSPHNGLLQEIATGEGKSIIIAMSAAGLALRGAKVDIITSSEVLARRDAEDSRKFFQMLGLSSSYNQSANTSIADKREIYKNDIIFGDIAVFQYDYLRSELNGGKSLSLRDSRGFDTALVDEVDSMLVDEGAKLAMVASNAPGMEYLNVILSSIWCQVTQELGRIVGDTLVVGEFKIHYTENGQKQIELLDKENGGKLPLIDKKLHIFETALQAAKKNLEEKFNYIIPEYLQEYARENLESWVNSALAAASMQKGKDYLILNKDGKNQIVPVDYKNTGVVCPSTKWGGGVHQFLQLKHKLPITPMALMNKYISNLSFFQKYGKNIFGMTGTLGSEANKELLREYYQTDFAYIPNYKQKQFIEYQPELTSSDEDYYSKIIEITEKMQQDRRASLVICETIEAASNLKDKLVKAGTGEKQIITYTRNDTKEINDLKRPVEPGEVIIATNLAGRGTDIKPSKEVISRGGLHVCVTFLPKNLRVEHQLFGRTARSGDPGSAGLILSLDDVTSKLECLSISSADEARVLRDEKESMALTQTRLIDLQQSVIEDELFSKFASSYNKLASSNDISNKLCKRERKWDYYHDIDNTLPGAFEDSGSYQRSSQFLNYKLSALQESFGFKLKQIKKDITPDYQYSLKKYFISYRFYPEFSGYAEDSLFRAVKHQVDSRASIAELKDLTFATIAVNRLAGEASNNLDNKRLSNEISDENLLKAASAAFASDIFILNYRAGDEESEQTTQEKIDSLKSPDSLIGEGKASIISLKGNSSLITLGYKFSTKFSRPQYYSLKPIDSSLKIELDRGLKASSNIQPEADWRRLSDESEINRPDKDLLKKTYEAKIIRRAEEINQAKRQYATGELDKFLAKKSKDFNQDEKIFENPIYLIREAKKAYDENDPGYAIKLLTLASNMDKNLNAPANSQLAKIFIKRGVTYSERMSFGCDNSYETGVLKLFSKAFNSLKNIETNLEVMQLLTGNYNSSNDGGLEQQHLDKLTAIRKHKGHMGGALEATGIKLGQINPDSCSYLTSEQIKNFSKHASKNNELVIQASRYLYETPNIFHYPEDVIIELQNFCLEEFFEIDVRMSNYAIGGACLKLSAALAEIAVGVVLSYAGCTPLARTMLQAGFNDILSAGNILADREEFDHKQYLTEKSIQAASTVFSNYMQYKFGGGVDMLGNTQNSLDAANQLSGATNLLNNCIAAGANIGLEILGDMAKEKQCQNACENYRQRAQVFIKQALERAVDSRSNQLQELLARDNFDLSDDNFTKIMTSLHEVVKGEESSGYQTLYSLISQTLSSFLQQTKLSGATSLLETGASAINSARAETKLREELEKFGEKFKKQISDIYRNSPELRDLLKDRIGPIIQSHELDSIIQILEEHKVILENNNIDIDKLSPTGDHSVVEGHYENISFGEEIDSDKNLRQKISKLLIKLYNCRNSNYEDQIKQLKQQAAGQLVEVYLYRITREVYDGFYNEIKSKCSNTATQQIMEIREKGVKSYAREKFSGSDSSHFTSSFTGNSASTGYNNGRQNTNSNSSNQSSGVSAGDDNSQFSTEEMNKPRVFDNFFKGPSEGSNNYAQDNREYRGYSFREAIELGRHNLRDNEGKDSLNSLREARRAKTTNLFTPEAKRNFRENPILRDYIKNKNLNCPEEYMDRRDKSQNKPGQNSGAKNYNFWSNNSLDKEISASSSEFYSKIVSEGPYIISRNNLPDADEFLDSAVYGRGHMASGNLASPAVDYYARTQKSNREEETTNSDIDNTAPVETEQMKFSNEQTGIYQIFGPYVYNKDLLPPEYFEDEFISGYYCAYYSFELYGKIRPKLNLNQIFKDITTLRPFKNNNFGFDLNLNSSYKYNETRFGGKKRLGSFQQCGSEGELGLGVGLGEDKLGIYRSHYLKIFSLKGNINLICGKTPEKNICLNIGGEAGFGFGKELSAGKARDSLGFKVGGGQILYNEISGEITFQDLNEPELQTGLINMFLPKSCSKTKNLILKHAREKGKIN